MGLDELDSPPVIDPEDFAIESQVFGSDGFHLVSHAGQYYAWIVRPDDAEVYEMSNEEAARSFLADKQAALLLSSGWGECVARATAGDPGDSGMVYDSAVVHDADGGVWFASYASTGQDRSRTLARFGDLYTAAEAFAMRADEVADEVERSRSVGYADIIAAQLRYRAASARADIARASLGNAIRRNEARIRGERAVSSVAYAVGVSREFLYRVMGGDEWAWKGTGGHGQRLESKEGRVSIPVQGKSDSGWTVTVRFAVDAADETEARSIVSGVLEKMEVLPSKRLVTAREGERTWTVEAELNLSGLEKIDPDDARSRLQYVTRNLGGLTWRVVRADERQGKFEWPPSFWAMSRRDEVLVHPAIKAADVQASAEL
jgi:hypothetical protein